MDWGRWKKVRLQIPACFWAKACLAQGPISIPNMHTGGCAGRALSLSQFNQQLYSPSRNVRPLCNMRALHSPELVQPHIQSSPVNKQLSRSPSAWLLCIIVFLVLVSNQSWRHSMLMKHLDLLHMELGRLEHIINVSIALHTV